MARFIPDVMDHLSIFPESLQNKLQIMKSSIDSRAKAALPKVGAPRLKDGEYSLVMKLMGEAGLEVAGEKLRSVHPLSGGIKAPDVMEVKNIFSGRAKTCAEAISGAIPFLPRKKLHVYQDDFKLLKRQLNNEGFDTSKGIKAGGIELISVAPN